MQVLPMPMKTRERFLEEDEYHHRLSVRRRRGCPPVCGHSFDNGEGRGHIWVVCRQDHPHRGDSGGEIPGHISVQPLLSSLSC